MDEARELPGKVAAPDGPETVVRLRVQVPRSGSLRVAGGVEGCAVATPVAWISPSMPAKLFLEDVDAAYDDFRSTIVAWLDEKKDGVPAVR